MEHKSSSSSAGRPMRFVSERGRAAIRLLQAASLVRRRASAVVEQYGVTIQQYNVLRILRGANEPLPILEIAERMIEQTPGITRLLDRLEAKGLVTRQRLEQDRRVYLCSITESGLALLTSMDQAVDEADESAIGDLSPEQVDQLNQILDTILR